MVKEQLRHSLDECEKVLAEGKNFALEVSACAAIFHSTFFVGTTKTCDAVAISLLGVTSFAITLKMAVYCFVHFLLSSIYENIHPLEYFYCDA